MKKSLPPALKTGLLILAGGALIFVLATFRGGKAPVRAPVPAPDFTLPDLKGRPTTLSSFKGRAVLLDFWATWCGPCLEELPDLAALHKKYEGRGFSVLGVSVDSGGAGEVAAFVRDHKMTYPVLISDGLLPENYAVPGLPTAFLIDRRGLIVRRYLGPQSYADLAKDAEEVLAP